MVLLSIRPSHKQSFYSLESTKRYLYENSLKIGVKRDYLPFVSYLAMDRIEVGTDETG